MMTSERVVLPKCRFLVQGCSPAMGHAIPTECIIPQIAGACWMNARRLPYARETPPRRGKGVEIACNEQNPVKARLLKALLKHQLLLHASRTSTATSVRPGGGRGTMLPATGSPSTTRETAFPSPARTTEMR